MTARELDPATFEVLRHRLWAINDEAAVTIGRVSGSPIATEGNDFNALLPAFKRAGATVLGVSKDSLKSHRNFCAKQGFQFDLASDADGALCDAFGVIQPKKLYGREFLGIVRSTYLIDPTGVVRQQWQPVKVAGHAQAVLDALKAHQAQ